MPAIASEGFQERQRDGEAAAGAINPNAFLHDEPVTLVKILQTDVRWGIARALSAHFVAETLAPRPRINVKEALGSDQVSPREPFVLPVSAGRRFARCYPQPRFET